MKIVGKTGGDYLAKFTELELCKLYGFDSLYSDGWRQVKRQCSDQHNGRDTLEGVTIDLHALFNRLKDLRNNEERAKSAAVTFRALADTLEMAWPALVVNEEEARL